MIKQRGDLNQQQDVQCGLGIPALCMLQQMVEVWSFSSSDSPGAARGDAEDYLPRGTVSNS